MIYLENNNGTQQIFIPKNLNISINKTYDEGFQDGMNYQKDKLEVLNVTENGVYKSDNGYKQVNVEVASEYKLEELNITINNDIEEYTATDSNLDGFSKVNVDATEFGENRYNLGYEQGYEQGKSDVGCNVGHKYHIVKDEHETINSSEFGYDGFNEVEIDASEFGNKKYEEGYNQGKSECGEGGSCNIGRLEEEISVNSTGHIVRYASDYGVDGWDYFNLDVNGYGNEKYQEGYAQGKSEGGDFSSSQVEETYSVNAIEMKLLLGRNPIADRTKITDEFGVYNPNGFIFLQDVNAVTASVWCKQKGEFEGSYVVGQINEWALEGNSIEWLKFNVPITFNENALGQSSNNIRRIYFSYDSITDTKTILRNDSLSNNGLLGKICFEGKVEINGNPFNNVQSEGFVYGLQQYYNEYYAPIMDLLGSGWIFIGCSSKEELLDKYYN